MVRLFRGLIAASLIFNGLPAVAAAPAKQSYAITGATILPMTGTERLTDHTVLVEDGKITAVAPTAALTFPADMKQIDATGLTLMPGLVDMHVHIAPTTGEPGDSASRALAVSLAHGVTTVRGMAGAPQHPALRDKVEQGGLPGPRLYIASPPINSGNAKDAATARQLVKDAKAAGFDMIKSHEISDVAVWEAVQDEAKKQGLATGGHVADAIGLDRALKAGQQIEHLDGMIQALLPTPAAPFGQIPPREVLDALAALSDADLDRLAQKVKASGTWHVPTLGLFERIVDTKTPPEAMAAEPAMRFVANGAKVDWLAQRKQLNEGFLANYDGQSFTDLRRRIVRAFAKADVPMMTGSDTPQFFHVWGDAELKEVEALVAAGLTPMQALRSATVVPRDYFRSLPNGGSALGQKADFGTIEPGARADLILLGGDPSADIAKLRDLKGVMAGGRYYDRAALDALLEGAARSANPQAAAAQQAQPAIYVMRHLHTPEGATDPDLTDEGQRHARLLADRFKPGDIDVIYVNSTKRTQQTAAPLAAKLGITPKFYDPRDTAALVAALKAEKGTVLVVGHSNTVPDIVAGLGGTRPAPLSHPDFADIWKVESKGTTLQDKIR